MGVWSRGAGDLEQRRGKVQKVGVSAPLVQQKPSFLQQPRPGQTLALGRKCRRVVRSFTLGTLSLLFVI